MKPIEFTIIILMIMAPLVTVMGANTPLRPAPGIRETVKKLIEGAADDEEKIRRIYYFVRDEIRFDWVYPQDIPPGEVLKNGKGVCMQKANLLVAMAREAGLKARFHFMYVRKNALEDFLPVFAYKRWVDPFPHTFPEIYLNGKWVPMEATFDRELHEACLRKSLNFARYPEIRSIRIDFSPEGVRGHQQFFHVQSGESFYGDDLTPLILYTRQSVPWYKRLLQPMIFKKAGDIMKKIRSE